MAGKQLNLFLGEGDQINFEQSLRKTGDILFFRESSKNGTIYELKSSIFIRNSPESFKVLIAEYSEIDEIVFKRPATGDIYYVDQFISPVIEFSRFPGVAEDGVLRPSRLYRIDQYWSSDGKLKQKSDKFIRWASGLFKISKESLTKIEQGCFAGNEALTLRRAGIPFEGLDPLSPHRL